MDFFGYPIWVVPLVCVGVFCASFMDAIGGGGGIISLPTYLLAGLPLFDSVNLTFTTISTGGMSIKNANVGFYNNNIVYLITMILMLLGATSFTVHYNLVKTKGKSILRDIQFQAIILSIIISGILIATITLFVLNLSTIALFLFLQTAYRLCFRKIC